MRVCRAPQRRAPARAHAPPSQTCAALLPLVHNCAPTHATRAVWVGVRPSPRLSPIAAPTPCSCAPVPRRQAAAGAPHAAKGCVAAGSPLASTLLTWAWGRGGGRPQGRGGADRRWGAGVACMRLCCVCVHVHVFMRVSCACMCVCQLSLRLHASILPGLPPPCHPEHSLPTLPVLNRHTPLPYSNGHFHTGATASWPTPTAGRKA